MGMSMGTSIYPLPGEDGMKQKFNTRWVWVRGWGWIFLWGWIRDCETRHRLVPLPSLIAVQHKYLIWFICLTLAQI